MRLLLAQSGHSATEFQCPLLEVKRTSARHCEMSAFDPKRTLYFVLLSRSGATLIHEGQRFWAAHVASLQSVKLETAETHSIDTVVTTWAYQTPDFVAPSRVVSARVQDQ